MTNNPRIVLDTNSLLQILGARSKYHFLFGKFRRKASPTAADLFLKVLARSRNVLRKDPYFRLDLVKQDTDDNKFVDCAFVFQADFIVTDDGHFNDVVDSQFPLFRVMGLDEFANQLLSSQ